MRDDIIFNRRDILALQQKLEAHIKKMEADVFLCQGDIEVLTERSDEAKGQGLQIERLFKRIGVIENDLAGAVTDRFEGDRDLEIRADKLSHRVDELENKIKKLSSEQGTAWWQLDLRVSEIEKTMPPNNPHLVPPPVEIGVGRPSDATIRATFVRHAKQNQHGTLLTAVRMTADQLCVDPGFVRVRLKVMLGIV